MCAVKLCIGMIFVAVFGWGSLLATAEVNVERTFPEIKSCANPAMWNLIALHQMIYGAFCKAGKNRSRIGSDQ